ncbi:M4 family metallopeptidase [Epilithonimonas zeae]|uniref:M4 family metallopeptidase n=1 Tax=Epilithonimonas zeae TaxID=1416779 RepID=UPI00200C88DC|nr:M4 family metallopeptidase [Epilithonimonas zeae]UQB67160.1 M4 family metallopeptidase [Epilithonimonas zeae]
MKKELLRIGILCSVFGFTLSANAQEYIDKKITDKNGNINLVTFKKNYNLSSGSSSNLFSTILNLTPGTEMRLQQTQTSDAFVDENYQMYFNNLKVEFGRYNLHYKNGNLISMNGDVFSTKDAITTPRMSASEAFSKALAYVNAKKYMWEDADYTANNAYKKPAGELVLLPVKLSENQYSLQLVYKFDVYAAEPISRAIIYVDALEGRVVFSNAVLKHNSNEDLIHNSIKKTQPIRIKSPAKSEPVLLALGNAETRYSGTKEIETTLVSGSYVLQDATRGNGVKTYNLKKSSTISSGVDFKDTDNNWTSAEYNNATFDNAALDAHWGVEKTYDYFKETFNRNSYDNNGAVLKSYVHYGSSYENAGWSGTEMIYGDGATTFKPLTAFDVTAHELGHAVCEYTANLAYERESGAMNEGFSDIWGAIVEHKYAPEKQNFLIGEDITKASPGYLRSMSNPKVALSAQPDTYRGTNWKAATVEEGCATPIGGSFGNDYCGVHTNSGVLNHWFYILVMGKTGTNDLGKSYNVTGIGWEKAEKIVYRLESTYLTANSNYKNARDFGIQTAKDLYGDNSAEMIAVQDAFYAVGVGVKYLSTPDIFPPTVPTNLVANNVKGTSANLTWNASTDNEGVDGYIIYKDGTEIARTSSLNYKATGLTKMTTYNFYVKAIDVYGNISSQSNTVDITTTNQAEYCTSQSSNTADEKIKRVVFAGIDNTSTGSAGYEDFTNISTEVTEGNTYAISITPTWGNTVYNEGYSVFIDWNGDGDFNDANEKALSVPATKTTPVTGNITVPANISFDSPLVMRVSMKFNSVPTSCESFSYGQVEDYTIIAKKKVLAVSDLAGKSQTIIYPNPVKDILNIRSEETGDSTYRIFNTAGQSVANGKSIENKIDVNKLPTGNYVIELVNKKGEKSTQKFIKK